ncbi:MAG: hypothetical protein KC620_26075, partial [Myxococcales bacterium]|nr:hypothetical protein [Myxococcales bacterium]
MPTSFALRMLFAAAIAASTLACGSLQRMMRGTETLEGHKVTALKASVLDGGVPVCAGQPVQVQVVAELADGPAMSTWVAGQETTGKLEFEDFTFESPLATVQPDNGTLVVRNDEALLNGPAVIQITSKHVPTATTTLEVAPHFGCGLTLDFSGRDGATGAMGQAGGSGAYGRDEQTSPSYAKPGGHGQIGGRGGNGGRGAAGEHGHDVSVELSPIEGKDLVRAKVTDHGAGSTQTVVLDPGKGARLTINADGGNGGGGG